MFRTLHISYPIIQAYSVCQDPTTFFFLSRISVRSELAEGAPPSPFILMWLNVRVVDVGVMLPLAHLTEQWVAF